MAVVGSAWVPTHRIRETLGVEHVSPTALAMRLRRLMDYGIVENRPSPDNPREYEWRRVEAPC